MKKLENINYCNGCSTEGHCRFRLFSFALSDGISNKVFSHIPKSIKRKKVTFCLNHRRPKRCIKENGIYEGHYDAS